MRYSNIVKSQKTTGLDTKSGQKMAKFSKDSVHYWAQKLIFKNNGTFHIRVQHAGKREWFNCNTANKQAAANKARDIYRTVVGNGWEKAKEQFKPKPVKQTENPTVGEFFKTVDAIRNTSHRSHYDSCAKFRRIIAEIKGIAREGGGAKPAEKWRKKVESVKLSEITPFDVEKWKIARLAKAQTQIEKEKAESTADSAIRCAKSLFKKRNLKLLKDFQLPDPLPFEQVETKQHLNKYVSTFDKNDLFAKAKAELKDDLLKIFMLSFGAGLRRGEIDHLKWSMINPEDGIVMLGATEHWKPKTKESQHPFPVSWEVIEALGKPSDGFVIAPLKKKEHEQSPDSFYPQQHRCSAEFKKLNTWLREKGVQVDCPTHTMRKEFGSMVNDEHGIEVAAKQLRHKTIGLTFAVYQDYNSKQRLTLSKTANNA